MASQARETSDRQRKVRETRCRVEQRRDKGKRNEGPEGPYSEVRDGGREIRRTER